MQNIEAIYIKGKAEILQYKLAKGNQYKQFNDNSYLVQLRCKCKY